MSSKTITPQMIYDAWPDSDLLGCGPPEKGASFEEYDAAAKPTAGNSLFLFALSEAIDVESDAEFVRMISRGADDLVEVLAALSAAAGGAHV